MAIAVTFLEQGRQAAATVATQLAAFIAAARSSLHLAIYDFRLSPELAGPIVAALRDRAAARVDVRIIYDAGKPATPFTDAGADPAPPGTSAFIKQIGGGVADKAITGGDPHLPKLMHHKYLVRDGRTPSAALWTGSSNFTDDSWSLEENNIVCIDSPELCSYFETDFAELWDRGDIATTGTNDTGTVSLEGCTIQVAFSPGQGRAIDHEIAHRIGTARRRLKICSMLLTSGAILGALGDVIHHGRVGEYGGVYDRTQMASVCAQWRGQDNAWKIAAFELAARSLSGKRSTPYAPNTPHDFMHNKVIVADDTVITGSYNLSHSATENAENVLMIQDSGLADRYVKYIDGLAARYG